MTTTMPPELLEAMEPVRVSPPSSTTHERYVAALAAALPAYEERLRAEWEAERERAAAELHVMAAEQARSRVAGLEPTLEALVKEALQCGGPPCRSGADHSLGCPAYYRPAVLAALRTAWPLAPAPPEFLVCDHLDGQPVPALRPLGVLRGDVAQGLAALLNELDGGPSARFHVVELEPAVACCRSRSRASASPAARGKACSIRSEGRRRERDQSIESPIRALVG